MLTFTIDDQVIPIDDTKGPWEAVDSLLCGLTNLGFIGGDMLLKQEKDGHITTADNFWRDQPRITVESVLGTDVRNVLVTRPESTA